MQQKIEKSCFRYKKNTWYIESNYTTSELDDGFPPEDLGSDPSTLFIMYMPTL